MSFLHTWAIFAGVLAAGLPVAVHFLTKPRPVRMPLSTIQFVMELVEQRRARHRLRDFLVLLFRTAAILLFAFALARPLFSQRPLLSEDGQTDVLRVVVVDVSQSMAAASHGVPVFERARSIAAEHL